jgi:predicted ABC-type ATPase
MIIVGGANGSGKTTFASRYHKELGVEFLNADNIATDLAEQGVPNAMIAAGRIFFRRLEQLIVQRKTFVVETTLSGSYINKVAKRAQAEGYHLRTIFIFLDSPRTCIYRVRARVEKGGHHVPTEDIIRRFTRANENFRSSFIGLSDSWILLYNGGDAFQHVAAKLDQEEVIYLPTRYRQFQTL